MMRDRIVVGVDGSADSEQALRWALSEARWSGSDVEMVYCWEPPHEAVATGYVPRYTTDDISTVGNTHLDLAMSHCHDDVQASRAAGVVISRRVVEGDARQALESESKDATMLVVGRRGHGWPHAPGARVPVVVVPADSRTGS